MQKNVKNFPFSIPEDESSKVDSKNYIVKKKKLDFKIIVIGLLIVAVFVVGIIFQKRQAKEKMRIELLVETACVSLEAMNEMGLYENVESMTMEQYIYQMEKVQNAVMVKMEPIMIKYDLTYAELMEEVEAARELMEESSSFEKKVLKALRESGCAGS